MIEEQRIADERNAVRMREQQRLETIAAAELAARDADAAQVRAQHAAKLALETARVTAEREGRMRVEAAAAAEHAHQLAILTAERQAREHELRRAEVAQKRPTWMVVVTAAAVAVSGVLLWFAFEKASASAESERARGLAEQDTIAAIEKQKEVEVEMQRNREELAGLAQSVAEAQARLDAAQTAADHTAAQADLDEKARILRKKKEEQDRLDAIKLKKQRNEPINLGKCANEALGCFPR